MKNLIKEVLETLVIALIAFFLIQVTVRNFRVDGESMLPSLVDGQYILVNKAVYTNIPEKGVARIIPFFKVEAGRSYLFHAPRRGEIIVFKPPLSQDRDFIKRIIGIPGDKVQIKQGKVLLNGLELQEPYIMDGTIYEFSPTEVPPGNYFVLGDNRNRSSDSHLWGVVPYNNIVGKAWVTLWPPKKWGPVPNFISEVTAAP